MHKWMQVDCLSNKVRSLMLKQYAPPHIIFASTHKNHAAARSVRASTHPSAF
jgi:hypothetical protein